MILHSKPWITEYDIQDVQSVLHSGMLSRSNLMENWEKKMAEYLNKKHALFTGNGTQALVLILKALGVGPGDEVITSTYVCDKVKKGIEAVGATAVLCDTNAFGLMDSANISVKRSGKTKAIVLVHIFGRNAWTDDLDQFQIPVIEDICQSFGHLKPEKRTGSKGIASFASFHGTKAMPLGEGGMLFTDNTALFEKIQSDKTKSGYYVSGTEITAALGLSQLKRMQETLERRMAIAARYSEEITPELTGTERLVAENTMHFRYVLHSDKNWEQIKQAYLMHEIHVRKGVDSVLHNASDNEHYQVATALLNTSVSIPILPQLSAAEEEHIIRTTNRLYAEGVL